MYQNVYSAHGSNFVLKYTYLNSVLVTFYLIFVHNTIVHWRLMINLHELSWAAMHVSNSTSLALQVSGIRPLPCHVEFRRRTDIIYYAACVYKHLCMYPWFTNSLPEIPTSQQDNLGKLERASERSEEEEVYTNFDLHVYFSGGSIDAILVANKVMMTK